MTDSTTAWSSIFFLLLTFAIIFFLKKNSIRRGSSSNSPTSCSYPIIGNLIEFLQNQHRFLDWATDLILQTPSSTLKVHSFGNNYGVSTANPTNIKHILKTNFSNYVKGRRYATVFEDLLGQGIFNVDGDLWMQQRKIASHEFSTNSLKSFVSETVRFEISDRLLPILSVTCDHNTIIDLQDVFQQLGFDNICNVAFGYDPACLVPEQPVSRFMEAFDQATKISTDRTFAPISLIWKIKRMMRIGSERKLRKAIEIVDEQAFRIIKSRRNELSMKNGLLGKQDLLSRFMTASGKEQVCGDGEQGNRSTITHQPPHDDKFLRDIIVSFILAGKDSTSTALTWFFWLLSVNPQCEHKIYKETVEIANKKNQVDGSKWVVFQYDDLKDMHYLHAALAEAMRLFPPVPIDSRSAVRDDVLPDGTSVESGWFSDYSAYVMGRSEELWGKNCCEFSPERWLDNGAFLPACPFKYPVFHAGPRACLGKDMAYIQMKSVVASVLYAFEVRVVRPDQHPPPYVLSLTLKMKSGLPVQLKKRLHED